MVEAGREPAALENRPEIPEYMAPYIVGFYRLSERRTMGFSSLNPISFAEMKAFLDLFPTDNVDLFLHMMTEMDSEYLSIKNKPKNVTVKTHGGQRETT